MQPSFLFDAVVLSQTNKRNLYLCGGNVMCRKFWQSVSSEWLNSPHTTTMFNVHNENKIYFVQSFFMHLHFTFAFVISQREMLVKNQGDDGDGQCASYTFPSLLCIYFYDREENQSKRAQIVYFSAVLLFSMLKNFTLHAAYIIRMR